MRALRMVMAMGAVVVLAMACGEDDVGGRGVDGGTEDGGIPGTDGGTDGGNDDGTDGGTDGGTGPITVTCQGKLYQCGNAVDDDADGLVDSQDPDCLGPCDNNESGFDPNISGGSSQNCSRVDCYFDQDSGGGNDNCEYDLSCDPNAPEPDCPYDDTCTVAAQAGLCLDVCEPLTPNGCDCFGCCNLSPTHEEADFRYIGTGTRQDAASCTLAAYNANPDDLEACAPCEPVLDCGRSEDCGRCQLCLNKTVDDLPEDCFTPTDPTDGGTGSDGGETDGGTTNPDQCSDGEQPCGLPGQAACDPGFYCITGCCRPAP